MKNSIAFLIILAMGTSAFASYGPDTDYQDYETTQSSMTIIDWQQSALNEEIISLIREMNMEVTADANSAAISKVNDSLNFANKCNDFASAADMGAWGAIIVKEMRASKPAALYKGTADLKAVCPRYDSLEESGKEAVWVMILNAMAHLESSCNKTVTAKGPNGSLIGLLQLHRGQEQKYAKNCRKGDGNSAEGQFRCGLSMLNLQLTKRQAVFARASYWDVLRPQARSQKYKKIQKAVGSLSICK